MAKIKEAMGFLEIKINQLELIIKKQVKVYLIILLKLILFRILKIIIKVQVDFLQVNQMMFQIITYLIKVNQIVIICLIIRPLIKTTLSLIKIRTNKISNKIKQIRINKIKLVFLITNHLLIIQQIIIY